MKKKKLYVRNVAVKKHFFFNFKYLNKIKSYIFLKTNNFAVNIKKKLFNQYEEVYLHLRKKN